MGNSLATPREQLPNLDVRSVSRTLSMRKEDRSNFTKTFELCENTKSLQIGNCFREGGTHTPFR
jgi:hypothetical protein